MRQMWEDAETAVPRPLISASEPLKPTPGLAKQPHEASRVGSLEEDEEAGNRRREGAWATLTAHAAAGIIAGSISMAVQPHDDRLHQSQA